MKWSITLAIACLSCAAPAITAQAGDERIFANGFDPCCQIGGTVTGLSGNGLVLHLHTAAIDEDNGIAGNGLYSFAASVPPGVGWTLSISTQPGGQTCNLSINSGTMGSSNINDADVSCAGTSGLNWDSGTWGEDWN